MSDFFRMDVESTLRELGVEREQGLDDAKVAERLTRYGRNELPTESGSTWLQILLGQFKELMVIILIVAALISFVLGDVKDTIVILLIVVLNALLGTYQEYQAERSLAALSALQVPQVRVRRNGGIHQISAEELVPGDIVVIEEGDRIPADGRLVVSVNLQLEEAALTGESQPVEKRVDAIPGDQSVPLGDRFNMAFMGTAVNYGRGEMVVVQTGLQTQLGKIAAMLMQVEEGTTPLQRRLNDLGRTLAIGAGIIVFIVFIAGVLRGIPAFPDMLLNAISLAVAAVPEGLPAIITIGLSLGAARMVKRHALIRRLPAVETLGSVTMICSDKTGTLTKNEMTATLLALPGVEDISVTGTGYEAKGEFLQNGKPLDPATMPSVMRFLQAMALSTNAHLDESVSGRIHVVGDTTEGALMVAARKVGWTRERVERELPRVDELPFSSDRKAMTTFHEIKIEDETTRRLFRDYNYVAITKGAPDRLIEWATREFRPDGASELTPARRKQWQEKVDSMAAKGLRVLGLAYRNYHELPEEITEFVERELVLLGLIGILDPARPEAKEAVKVAREAGIRSVMITGDHALTAEAIALDLGILQPGQKVITGTQLDTMSDAEIGNAFERTAAFARVSPEHKLKIVKVLQGKNQIVAMTGDGVNDAPALKQADIGVAMGITGTDVSKGAAEMVLTDDNFASIVAAVEEGRVIYDNIRKFVKYLLSSNVGEILVMFVALLAGLKIPLVAIQILWINLVTDGLPAIALGFEPAEDEVMKRKPRQPNESIFAGGMGRHIIWVSILLTIVTLFGYVYGYSSYGMNPFSSTLQLEDFDRQKLVSLIGEELAPADWDSLTDEQQHELILEGESTGGAEEASEGILGEAEKTPRTLAFTILALGQIFHVSAIHAGDKASFFREFFKKNMLLFYAAISTFLLQIAVVYAPFMQAIFETKALTLQEFGLSIVLASLILFGVEVEKFVNRRPHTTAPVTTAANL
jgi:Ca2+-transporting ATPase